MPDTLLAIPLDAKDFLLTLSATLVPIPPKVELQLLGQIPKRQGHHNLAEIAVVQSYRRRGQSRSFPAPTGLVWICSGHPVVCGNNKKRLTTPSQCEFHHREAVAQERLLRPCDPTRDMRCSSQLARETA